MRTMSQGSSNIDPGMASLLRWVLGYARRRWYGVAFVLLLMLLRIGINVLRPWPMKVLVDHVLEGRAYPSWLNWTVSWLPAAETARDLVLWCVIGMFVIFLLGWTLTAAGALASLNLGQRISYDLAADLFRHLQRLSMRFHNTRSTGDSIRRVLTDSNCISTILKDAMLPALTSVVSLVLMFAILWHLDWLLALVSLAVVPMIALALRLYSRPMLELSYAQQEADGKIYGLVERGLAAIPVIQTFVREDHAAAELRSANAASLRAAVAATNVQVRFKVLIGFATAAGMAMMIWLGARQVLAGHLTVGELLVFLAYLASLYAPLEVLAYTSSTGQTAAGSARRVLEVLNTTQELPERLGAKAVTHVRGAICIENVTAGYEQEKAVLHDVSLAVAPGETIAIVGPTGAGKTTLTMLIPRFLDAWQGRVLVDGQDVRDLSVSSLRQQISIVLQEPFLFPTTIAQNIRYGRPDARMAEIEAAARAANAHEFISALPEGYDTVVGERGATLSGGQRQRISIARALLKNAPILILDEPTSAIDARTEAPLLQAIARLQRGRTTFVIAHRLSTIRTADRIVAMENGRIVEIGPHAELLRRGGLYWRLYQRQLAPDSTLAAGGVDPCE